MRQKLFGLSPEQSSRVKTGQMRLCVQLAKYVLQLRQLMLHAALEVFFKTDRFSCLSPCHVAMTLLQMRSL